MARERTGYIERQVIKVGNVDHVRLYVRMRYVDPTGKSRRIRRRVANEAQGRKLIARLLKTVEKSGAHAIAGDSMKFRDLAAAYKKQYLIPAKYHGEGTNARKVAGLRSWKTLQGTLHTLIKHFGGKLIRMITHAELDRFRLSRISQPVIRLKRTNKKGKADYVEVETQRAIATVNRDLELMRAVMAFGEREGWIARSPFKSGSSLISKADEARRERVLSHDEERLLLDECLATDKHGRSHRAHLRPLLIVALDTAMRRGELFKLRWRDVNFVAGEITIIAMNAKTSRSRSVGMTPRVRHELEQLKAVAPPEGSVLVFGIRDTVKRSFAAACAAAGIVDFRFHDCRHTAITRMVQAGLNSAEIMKISGHTQPITFSRYVNPDAGARRRAADALAVFNAEADAQHDDQQLIN